MGGGCIIHQLLKSKSILEYWMANFNAALCHADLLNAVSGVANVLDFFFLHDAIGHVWIIPNDVWGREWQQLPEMYF